MTRTKLPNRRPGLTEKTFHTLSDGRGVQELTITANIDPSTDRIREVFVANPMKGSDLEALLTDGCILISLCLQSGVELREIVEKLGVRRQYNEDLLECPPTSHLGSIARTAMKLDKIINEEKK